MSNQNNKVNNHPEDDKAILCAKSPVKKGRLYGMSLNIIKKITLFLTCCVIFFAIVFSLFRALTPWVAQYKNKIETHLSTLIGQPVTIERLETSWYWFEPVLKLNDVSILDTQKNVLKLHTLLVGVNLFSSIWQWHIQPGVLYIDDVHLKIRQTNYGWHLEGINQDGSTMHFDLLQSRSLMNWLMLQHKIMVKNISAMVYLQNGSILPFKDVTLNILNRSGGYFVKGHAKLAQTVATKVTLLAELNSKALNFDNLNGRIYLAAQNLNPAQWQGIFRQNEYQFQGGNGQLAMWFDVANTHLSSVQTRMNLTHLALQTPASKHLYFVQKLQANLAWHPTVDGWQLAGDEIQLELDGQQWPTNQLRVDYQTKSDAYRIFLKSLDLTPLQTLDIAWPQMLQPILAAKPTGELQNLQLMMKQSRPDYLLGQFKRLSWLPTATFPGVKQLSGALYWQPTEGHLEVDSQDVELSPAHFPPIIFSTVEGVVDWKALSHGFRISLDRLLIANPDLTLNARGVWDKPLSVSGGDIRMIAKYSANHAAQWLTYLPKGVLKPKLYEWLKNNIYRIEHASGQLKMEGPLFGFPFDKGEGIFSFSNHLSGVDLTFKDKWPLTKNIVANLYFNQRRLEADVHSAQLKDMMIHQANVRIDDLGLDRETLLLHTKVQAPAQKLFNYVKNSPLNKRLAKLHMLTMDGDLNLDLQFEIPLYPENDKVLANGQLRFNDNRVNANYMMQKLQLDSVSGHLLFDELGIVKSNLKAALLGDPLNIQIQSVRSRKPFTRINVSGHTPVELIKERLEIPLMSFVRGGFSFAAQMILTDDPDDLDTLHLTTSLKGVANDLPRPFGKKVSQSALFDLKADFYPQKTVNLFFNYDNRISAKLWFDNNQRGFQLKKGTFRMGRGKITQPKDNEVSLIGTLSFLDWQKWQAVLAQYQHQSGATGLLGQLSLIDLKLRRLMLGAHRYDNLMVKADKRKGKQWFLVLSHPDIRAKLHYHPQQNRLSGTIEHLLLPKPDFHPRHQRNLTTHLYPSQIPDLELVIKQLQVGDMHLGALNLKANSQKTSWNLTEGLLQSPDYEMHFKGKWRRQGDENNTDIQAKLYVHDLAQSLQRFNIKPVVEARTGDVFLNGSWPGVLFDFSLASIKGHMTMNFKDGRISHLSPETEEKLGLGKLLSILSLQTIPRRLKLDFSDLANNGYSFDRFKGGFILKKGIMSTTDSYIDGPVAHAGIKGDLDLVRQRYNLELRVSPHITASLPVVATIAGGPVAGIATWIASKLITQSMQQISGYTYKITGPWLKPVVQQVSITKV